MIPSFTALIFRLGRILAITLAVTLTLAHSPPALAGACDCVSDPLAKGGCGLKPVGMTDADPFSEVACGIDAWGFNSVEELIAPLYKSKAEDLDSPFIHKKKKELINYLSCYRDNDQQFCHFKKSLAPYVAYACEVSGLPLSIESCLLMKESSFKPTARSSEGAMGYAQLMEDALKDLEKCFEHDVAGWDQEITKKRQELADLKNGKPTLSPAEKSKALKAKETSLLLYRSRKKARSMWDTYWKGTPGNPCSAGKQQIKKGGCLKKEMTTCYRYAPLLSVMKQTLDASSLAIAFLDEDYDQDRENDGDSIMEIKASGSGYDVNGMSEMDTALFLTGSYNYGAPGFARLCGDKSSIQSCIESMSKKSETRKHLQGIRNCAQRDSLAPVQDPYNAKRKTDCEKKKCYR